MLSKLFFWFADFLRSKNAKGAIVAESRDYLDQALLRTYLRSKNASQYNSFNLRKKTESMKKYVTSIRFESKEGLWPALELADLVSFLAFQSVNKKIRHFTSRGIKYIWYNVTKKIDKKCIKKATKGSFKAYISTGRIRKISNYVKSIDARNNTN